MQRTSKPWKLRKGLLLALFTAIVAIAFVVLAFRDPASNLPVVGFLAIEYQPRSKPGYLTRMFEEAANTDEWPQFLLDSELEEKSPQIISTIEARIKLEHRRGAAIGYISFDGVPQVFCRIWFQDGTQALIHYPYRLSGGPHVLAKGDHMNFSVLLPANASSWQIGFTGWKAGYRHRLARVVGSRLNWVPSGFWAILPDPRMIETREFWSDRFDILDTILKKPADGL